MGLYINLPLTAIPGTPRAFSYQNEPYILGAYLVEKFSGLSFRDFLQKSVFSKAGMKNSYYDPWEQSFQLTNLPSEYYKYVEPGSTKPFSVGACPKGVSSVGAGGSGAVSTSPNIRAFYKSLFLTKTLVSQQALDAIVAAIQYKSLYFEVFSRDGGRYEIRW